MNLNNPRIVRYICEVIMKTKVLQLVNLSWAHLDCQSLSTICSKLPERLLSLRAIDFSYNKLNFNPEYPEDLKHSTDFVNYLLNFLG
jgi:hypothetical protein